MLFFFLFFHLVEILYSKKNTDQCTPQVTSHFLKRKPYNNTIHNMMRQTIWVKCTSWWYCTFKNQRHKNFGTWNVPYSLVTWRLKWKSPKSMVNYVTYHCSQHVLGYFYRQLHSICYVDSKRSKKEPNWDNHIDHIVYNFDQTCIVCVANVHEMLNVHHFKMWTVGETLNSRCCWCHWY
jgi:hypothetical protein